MAKTKGISNFIKGDIGNRYHTAAELLQPKYYGLGHSTIMEKISKEQFKAVRKLVEEDFLYFRKFPKTIIEEEDNMDKSTGKTIPGQIEERKFWSLYEVIMVDKEKLEILVDKKVIAKNTKQAKGKTGVEKIIAENDYDESKFSIINRIITDIREVEDDE